MTYEYDHEADGLYIWFVQDIEQEKANYESEIWPEELKNEIGLLFDKKVTCLVWKLCQLQNTLTKKN